MVYPWYLPPLREIHLRPGSVWGSRREGAYVDVKILNTSDRIPTKGDLSKLNDRQEECKLIYATWNGMLWLILDTI
jgi:hypothetical protein